MKRPLILFILFAGLCQCQQTGQRPDDSFDPAVKNPAYDAESGPLVYLDEGHANFHTAAGRYRPFVKILARDGYRVEPFAGTITPEALAPCRIFVSSVPTSRDNRSAFSADEIAVLKEWTEHGGSLLLITDHMPDPPAMAGLAAAFGITLLNGYVLNDNPAEGKGPIYFRRSDGTLADHAVTRGRPDYDETISSVTSFTGCAFRAPDGFEPLMTLGPLKTCWLTEKEGEFPEGTPTVDVEGWYQGGLFEPGRGRAAFFAEAGMFSAQIIGGTVKFGMNADIAPQNAQFVLNLMHWLDGLI